MNAPPGSLDEKVSGDRRKGREEKKKADGDTWSIFPGTLHLNDITQTLRQNNT